MVYPYLQFCTKHEITEYSKNINYITQKNFWVEKSVFVQTLYQRTTWSFRLVSVECVLY